MIQQLLRDKLKEDIIHELSQEYHNGSLSDPILSLSFDIFEIYINKLSEKYSSSKVISLIPDNRSYDDTHCCARVWNHKRGTRCTRPHLQGEDYCKVHKEQLDKYGYLRFRRYDEGRPIINEYGNKIPWNDGIHSLDMLMRYQRSLLHHLIKTSLSENR